MTHQPIVIDPETGRTRIVELPFSPEDMAFDIDGLAYLRTFREVVRYDPEKWREVPFDYGEERSKVGRWDGKQAKGIIGAVPIETRSIWHQGGLWVSPKGHLAVSFYGAKMISGRERRGGRERTLFEGWKPWRPTVFPGRGGSALVQVWDRHGKLLRDDAVRGLGVIDGIAIDKSDNLYMLAAATRMFGRTRYFDYMTGTLVKVRPESKILNTKAKIALRHKPNRPPDTVDGQLGAAWWEGAEWFYGGLGFTGKDGSHAAGGCACWNARFALDYYARSFAPETQHYSVAVLDSAGNLILRIGQYGNVDDGIPPVPDRLGAGARRSLGGDEVALFYPVYLATHTDRRLFITDPGNMRIVSVELNYNTTETVALKTAREGKGE
jgi:hypothetical protein